MKLTIGERIRLGSILQSQQSDFVTLKLIKELELRLSFSAKEITKYEINTLPTGTFYNDKDATSEIEIGEIITKIIVDSLYLLDKNKKLTQNDFTLYEKFIINKK